VGQKLKIFDLTKNLADPDARKELRSLLREIADIYADKASAASGDRKKRYQKDR
jgi:hypothetical protein